MTKVVALGPTWLDPTYLLTALGPCDAGRSLPRSCPGSPATRDHSAGESESPSASEGSERAARTRTMPLSRSSPTTRPR